MLPGKNAYSRYKVIDALLRNKLRKYPTMEDILQACWEKLDYRPSKETIQKDLANMKSPHPNGFDAPIQFNRTYLGYEYTDPEYSLLGISLRPEEIATLNESVELIRSIGGSHIGGKFNHAIEKLFSTTLENSLSEERKPVLQTMNPPVSRGFEHFDLLYSACKEQIPVSFIHFSYKKRKFKSILIHPFLIKEFENRWYLIGYSETHNSVRTFGFDRISDPLLLKKKFIKTDITIITDFLNNVYGVYPIPEATLETVELNVSRLGTHYFLAYPLHESQTLTKNDDGSSTISFKLIPSVELARYILSQGKLVSIQGPEWFKNFTLNLLAR